MANLQFGDWLCPKCGDLVFARNAACRQCHTPKPSGVMFARKPIMLSPGDWICKGCGDLQFRRNDTCRRCATTRDGVPPSTAPSRASMMGAPLQAGAAGPGFAPMQPTMASFNAYGIPVSSNGQLLTEGDWNCPKCGDLQFRRNVQCRKCGNAKPGMEATVTRMKLEGAMPMNDYLNPGKANPQGNAAMQIAMAKLQADLSKSKEPAEKGFRKFSDGPSDSRTGPVHASLWKPEALRMTGEGSGGSSDQKAEGPTPPEQRTVKVDNVQSQDSVENDVLKVMNFKFGTVANFTVGDNADGSVHVLVEFESVEASQKALTKQVMKFNGQTWPISSPSGEVVKPQGLSASEAPKGPRMGNPTGGDGDADDALKFAFQGRGGEASKGAGAERNKASKSRSRKRKKDKDKDRDRDRRRRRDDDEGKETAKGEDRQEEVEGEN